MRAPGKFKSFPCPGLDNFEDQFVKGDCLKCEAGETGCGSLGYFADAESGRGPQYLLTFSQEEPDGILEYSGLYSAIASLNLAVRHSTIVNENPTYNPMDEN
jgi:hypothetical protein